MGSDHREVREACQEDVTFGDGPHYCQFNDAYRLLGSDEKRDPAWIKDQGATSLLLKDKPRPWRLASVHRRVSLPGSKYDKMGADVSDFLTAASNSSFQAYSCLVLKRGRNGDNNVAIVGVLADS